MLEILDLLLRLISLVMSKQQEMEIKTILRQIIEKLTPFDCQFKEFYVVSGLIKNPYEEQ